MIKKPFSLLTLLFIFNSFLLTAQNLINGPMVGHAAMREVLLWVQTDLSSEVTIEYWESSVEKNKFKTETIRTTPESSFTGKLLANKVLPGKTYRYRVLLNQKPLNGNPIYQFKTPELWQWRKDPPDFTFSMGSCLFINDEYFDRPGKPYGGNYQILSEIPKTNPDFMLWLGDNIYLREADWDSFTGITYRYTHTRQVPEMKNILANVSNYATWDDHDYGPNDSDRGYSQKQNAWKAFNLFWANPATQIFPEGGVTNTFEWGDAQFFLLDNRFFRSPNNRITGEKSYLGKQQLDWVIDALSFSKATFKFIVVGGQVLNPTAIYETFAQYPEELSILLNEIHVNKIEGVIFLTGDRHHSEITQLVRPNAYPLFDITASPLTAGISVGHPEENPMRIVNSKIDEHNFASITISGKRKERIIGIQFYSSEGKKLFFYEIHEKLLKYSK